MHTKKTQRFRSGFGFSIFWVFGFGFGFGYFVIIGLSKNLKNGLVVSAQHYIGLSRITITKIRI